MKQSALALTLLGGVVAVVGLLFLGCGPTPGWTCGVPAEGVLVSYLFGATGAALITGAQMKGRKGSTPVSLPSSHQGFVATATILVGATVMMLGLLFSCATSLIAGAACGVGPLSALIAYGFAIGGASLVAIGSFEIRIWWTVGRNNRSRKSS